MSQPRQSDQVREAFLRFFEERGHCRLPSDSLVPASDPTLLFTGAGMNQFKDEFLGRGRRGLRRATTVQKCIRVPDLENVGRTPRHHTFFEMLGNFSFGDYFKAETIPWEWQFFTGILGWDADRMVATVYQDDEEAWALWHEAVGLPEERIYRFGEKENFWPAEAPSRGPDGPCGPCSELYYDLQPGAPMPDPQGLEALPDRFLEVGNFVFTQFDRRAGGELAPLPQRNIDVGCGLERIAAVAQGVPTNFETDLFRPTLEALQSLTGRHYERESATGVRMRRIADHARAVFFCIADGAAPGRDGRGYVVRKILRRAVRDGVELGLDKPFLASLLPAVQEVLGGVYPEIVEQEPAIQALVEGEEERFREVYRAGIQRLDAVVEDLRHRRGATLFPGAVAFELHDTYGFPVDITEVIVREQGLDFDLAGFEEAMQAQRFRARRGSALKGEVFAESLAARLRAAEVPPSRFVGWEMDESAARILALARNGELVSALEAGEDGEVLLDTTPFYAAAGGQVGDRGSLRAGGRELLEVQDVQDEEGHRVHRGRALARLETGQEIVASVDRTARRATEAHHTATHLLHAALKQVLGDHVQQAGSLVAPDRLRFDYTHPEGPGQEQLDAVEDLVNMEILAAREVSWRITSLAEARREGVTALFGERYGEEVRVVEVPGFSRELCGGTHVRNTGAIGPFRILGDRALAAGVRRIEAVAGSHALQVARRERDLLQELESLLKAPRDRLVERVVALREELRQARSARRQALPSAADLARELSAAGGPLGWRRLPGLDADALRRLAGQVQHRSVPPVVVLLGGEGDRIPFVVLCRPEEAGARAGDLARDLGRALGGGGGGRPDFAQGQACREDGLEAAVDALAETLAGPA